MKDKHEEKLKLNATEFENEKTTVAKAEACAEMVTKDEHNKQTERESTKEN